LAIYVRFFDVFDCALNGDGLISQSLQGLNDD